MCLIFEHIFDNFCFLPDSSVVTIEQPLIKGLAYLYVVVDFWLEGDPLHLGKLEFHHTIGHGFIFSSHLILTFVVLGWDRGVVFDGSSFHCFEMELLALLFNLSLLLLLLQNRSYFLFDVVDGFHVGCIMDRGERFIRFFFFLIFFLKKC